MLARAAPRAHLFQFLGTFGHFKFLINRQEAALNLPDMLTHRVILFHQLMESLLALLDD
jgi:hypothetical protein